MARRAFTEFVGVVYPDAPPPTPPYEEEEVEEWVGDMVANGVLGAATNVSGLNKSHERAGGRRLLDNGVIREALAGFQRLRPLPVAKKPFTVSMLGEVAALTDRGTLRGARDLAMLVVAHAGAFRGGPELCAARFPLHPVEGGAQVFVHTKTDKNVHATSARRIPLLGAGGLSPLGVLRQYLRLSGHTTGPLFRNMSGGGARMHSNMNPVSYSTFSALVKHWAGELGFDASEFASHSMRHGCADDLKRAGVPTAVGMAVTNHASTTAYAAYGGAEARRRGAAIQRRGAAEARLAAATALTSQQSAVWSAAALARSSSCCLVPFFRLV